MENRVGPGSSRAGPSGLWIWICPGAVRRVEVLCFGRVSVSQQKMAAAGAREAG